MKTVKNRSSDDKIELKFYQKTFFLKALNFSLQEKNQLKVTKDFNFLEMNSLKTFRID
jgi:hypothetical protein